MFSDETVLLLLSSSPFGFRSLLQMFVAGLDLFSMMCPCPLSGLALPLFVSVEEPVGNKLLTDLCPVDKGSFDAVFELDGTSQSAVVDIEIGVDLGR